MSRIPAGWQRWAMFAAGLAAGVALLWFAMRGAGISDALAVLERGHPALIALAIGANVVILGIGAALWRALLPRRSPVAHGRMFEVVALMAAIVNTVPALAGHVSGVVLLGREPGVGVRAATSVLALDQLGEALSKVAVLLLAAVLLPLPEWIRAAIGTVSVIAVVLLAILLAAGVAGARTAAAGQGEWRAGFVRWAGDLEVLRSPGRAVRALALALAMKAAEAAALIAVQLALGVDLPLAASILVLAAVNLATMVPVSPGNVGTYEAAAVAAYRWLGVDHPTAVALALASHACYLAGMLGPGAAVAALRSGRLAAR